MDEFDFLKYPEQVAKLTVSEVLTRKYTAKCVLGVVATIWVMGVCLKLDLNGAELHPFPIIFGFVAAWTFLNSLLLARESRTLRDLRKEVEWARRDLLREAHASHRAKPFVFDHLEEKTDLN